MPRLPQETDYGARPSLGVNRLDRPSGDGVLLADDVLSAATTFSDVLADKREKQDQLNYSLARNEMVQMDLEERAKLSEDLDWKTHDQRYSDAFTTGRQEISDRYGLTSHDMAILDSEANLIHAQGRVQVGGRARDLEVGEAVGRYKDGKIKARETVILADPGTRNRMVIGQLESIDAMEREGYMTPEEAVAEREEVTQDFALASLDAMPPDERYRVIAASLRYRQGYGADLGDYSESFQTAAARTGLPAGLIQAVASRESSLDPSAVNPDTGAAGLMQLMEGTAGDLGVTNRLDPDQSIQGGADYLNQQFRHFEDLQKALAAYNWGPQNVKDAVAEHGDDWLASAPEETREYVAALVDEWDSVGGGDKEVKTDSGAGALTPEDIRNGLGTGSIADFLHADTAAKMMEIAGKEDKTNRDRMAAQDVTNAAWRLYPEDDIKRKKHIRDNSSGTIQNLAEEDSRQRQRDEDTAKAEASQEKLTDESNLMLHEGKRFKDIPSEELREMTIPHQVELEKLSNRLSYGEQWAAVTQYTYPKDSGMSLEEWNSLPDFGPAGKTAENLETALYYNAFTEKDWNKLEAEQVVLKRLEGTRITTGELAPRAMVNNALYSMGFTVDDDKGDVKLNGIRARLENELRRRIVMQQDSTTPPTELDEQAKNKILAEILIPYAFHDTDYFTSDYDPEEAVPIWLMTAEQREGAYINLEKANADPNQSMMVGGQELNLEQIIRKLGTDATPTVAEPSAHNLRRAAFAWVHRSPGQDMAEVEAEVLRRLRGE